MFLVHTSRKEFGLVIIMHVIKDFLPFNNWRDSLLRLILQGWGQGLSSLVGQLWSLHNIKEAEREFHNHKEILGRMTGDRNSSFIL